jgi:hypothetical protein
MPESTQHVALVRRLVSYVNSTFSECQSLSVICDLPIPIGGERPPRIQGFTPDLYAVDVPATKTILGEAKTQKDLETEHTRHQLTAFLYYLSCQSRGVLIVAVPWQIVGATQRTMRLITGAAGNPRGVDVIILDEIREYRTQ